MTTVSEEWILIENGGSYEISNYGQVRNKNTNNILKLSLLAGYLAISLTINNRKMLSKIVVKCFSNRTVFILVHNKSCSVTINQWLLIGEAESEVFSG